MVKMEEVTAAAKRVTDSKPLTFDRWAATEELIEMLKAFEAQREES